MLLLVFLLFNFIKWYIDNNQKTCSMTILNTIFYNQGTQNPVRIYVNMSTSIERRIKHVYYRRLYLVSKECGLKIHSIWLIPYFIFWPLSFDLYYLIFLYWILFVIYQRLFWDSQIKQHSTLLSNSSNTFAFVYIIVPFLLPYASDIKGVQALSIR